jgi:hypothetical protein
LSFGTICKRANVTGAETRSRPDRPFPELEAASSACSSLFDNALCFLVKALARFGGRQSAGRTQYEAHAQPLFELADRLRDRRLAEAHLLCRGREGPGLDNANEGFHCGEAIHATHRPRH